MKLAQICVLLGAVAGVCSGVVYPHNYYGDPSLPSILRQCTEEAIREHKKDPGRCYTFQILDRISRDAANKFKRRTGKTPTEANIGPHVCSLCKIVFDDYAQARIHLC